MAGDSDDIVSLPSPPPPRPAARREAIEAALRKFDGIEEPVAPRQRPRRIAWAGLNRGPAGALTAAAIVALVSIPAIQIALRDRPPEAAEEAGAPAALQPVQDRVSPAGQASRTPQAPADEAVAAEAEPSPAQPAAPPAAVAEVRERRAEEQLERRVAPPPTAMLAPAPAPVIAAPPPPPPPPPPAEPQAEASDVGSIVVSGSRIPAPSAKSNGLAQRAEPRPSRQEIIAPYRQFLSRLQDALGANDRRAVIRLVGLPLRVNFAGGSRTYRSSRDVERDYDRIFTPAVRETALDLGTYDLTSRDGGRLRGSGRIWFGCGNRTCSSESVIKVREINP